MADIFISYAREDRSRVKPIAKALESLGWSVWWDPKIRSGMHFDRLIEKALKKAKSVLVVWSAKSVNSDWVRAEAAYGLEQDFLISISIDKDVRPPIRFYHIHTEPLIGWDAEKPSTAFDKIVSDLEAILGKPNVILIGRQQQGLKPGDMVKIPKGLFLYGEKKIEKLIDYDYFIDVFPVTNERYKEFLDENPEWQLPYKKKDYAEPYNWDEDTRNYPKGKSNHPVVLVSNADAEQFCKWRSQKEGKEYRLPLAEEWEKAARGTDGREYPWGSEFNNDNCNVQESGIGETTEVNLYPDGTSPFGCFDMSGNVWEWTSTWFDTSQMEKVLRGGSWANYQDDARCAYRSELNPTYCNDFLGFRCVRI